jgi:hypothetical protein
MKKKECQHKISKSGRVCVVCCMIKHVFSKNSRIDPGGGVEIQTSNKSDWFVNRSCYI